jgi:ubiquitin-activating enzyme E1
VSILQAESFNVPVPDWATNPKKLAEAVGKVSLPEFAPKGVKIVTDEKTTNLASASIDDEEVINDLMWQRHFLLGFA